MSVSMKKETNGFRMQR